MISTVINCEFENTVINNRQIFFQYFCLGFSQVLILRISKGFFIASSRIKKYPSDFSHLRGRNILIMLFAYYIINFNI